MPDRAAISAVLLAAGASIRLRGPTPKQLLDFDGRPLVRRLALRLLQSSAGEVIVVTGYRRGAVEEAVEDLDVALVHNGHYADGLSTSVRAGLAVVSSSVAAACFVPCDQPHLEAATLDLLFDQYRRSGGQSRGQIVVPTLNGRRGAPVVFDRELFAELERIGGDEGGRQLFERYAERVVEVEIDDRRALLDIDSTADLERLRAMR